MAEELAVYIRKKLFGKMGITMNDLAKYIDFGQGAANPGYIWDIKNVMKRAEAGEKLTIGFIGGSITQGRPVINTCKNAMLILYMNGGSGHFRMQGLNM